MKFIFSLLAAFICVFLLIKFLEWSSTYYPSRDIAASPDLIGLPFEEVFITTSDNNKIHGWFIPCEDAKYTLLFCHGNAGNISHRMDKIYLFNGMHLNTFIFDYRGYGKSQGFPTEQGLYRDVEAAYEYLTKKRGIHKDTIILYGESLGGAVVIHLADSMPVKAIITEEAFSSVKDMARIYYPFIPGILISNSYDSVSKISKISCPKLIIHSSDDDIVPYSLGEKLYKKAATPKQLLTIHGSHNSAFFDSLDEVRKGIILFIDALKPGN